MPDISFAFAEPTTCYAAIVQHRAVACHILHRHLHPSHFVDGLQQLVRMWRARLLNLNSQGWPAIEAPQALQWARNCYPSGVVASPRTRPCNFRRVCPFCWSRYFVLRPYRILRTAFSEPGTVLVSRRRDFRRLIAAPNEDSGTRLRNILYDVIRQRRDFVKRLQPLGAYFNFSISPGHDHWVCQQQQLFQLHPGQRLPEAFANRGRVRYFPSPNANAICDAVAGVCHYPRRMMFGDPQFTLLLLQIFKQTGVRLNASFGRFRGLEANDNG